MTRKVLVLTMMLVSSLAVAAQGAKTDGSTSRPSGSLCQQVLDGLPIASRPNLIQTVPNKNAHAFPRLYELHVTTPPQKTTISDVYANLRNCGTTLWKFICENNLLRFVLLGGILAAAANRR